jgi:hypothetical protein
MSRPVISYVEKLCGNIYLALYALLPLINPSNFLVTSTSLHYLALLLPPQLVDPIHW